MNTVKALLAETLKASSGLSEDEVMSWLEDPCWDDSRVGCGDWRNYVPSSVLKKSWSGLSVETRLAVFFLAAQEAERHQQNLD
jgi:hypothetical protein